MKREALFFALIFFFLLPQLHAKAEELTPVLAASGGQKSQSMTDGDYNTSAAFSAGDTITVTASDGGGIDGIYLKWDSPVVPYLLDTDSGTLTCGENGFLHEYIPFHRTTHSVTIHIPEDRMRICGIRIFDGGASDLPADVQVWEPPCERADILLVSSHADDEILFLGGIIPTYGAEQGAAVQVVYLTEYWSGTRIREHEKLDGLWVDGLKTYPVCGNFRDVYAETLQQAESLYDLDAITDYLTDTFRRMKPQVVVTHDFQGEYGHGFHQLAAKATSLALENAADPQYRADSEVYSAYGVWDTPKAYFHLYRENTIHMDLRIPLASMNGMTALEVAENAYKQHVSQQWCWFYVSDTYKYSCADFGLYRTNVGCDTTDDMLENITLYAEQERLEQERLEQEEKERLEQESLERERLEQEERARLEQAAREEAARLEAETKTEMETENGQSAPEPARQKENWLSLSLFVLPSCFVIVSLGFLLFSRKDEEKKQDHPKSRKER